MMQAGLVSQAGGVGPGLIIIDRMIMIVSGVVSVQVVSEGPKGWGLMSEPPARFEGCITPV